jgi:hypothetical protein
MVVMYFGQDGIDAEDLPPEFIFHPKIYLPATLFDRFFFRANPSTDS